MGSLLKVEDLEDQLCNIDQALQDLKNDVEVADRECALLHSMQELDVQFNDYLTKLTLCYATNNFLVTNLNNQRQRSTFKFNSLVLSTIQPL